MPDIVLIPVTCAAILPASNEFMALFVPPVFEGVTVYGPDPNMFSKYWPAVGPIPSVVAEAAGKPSAVSNTFETKRGFGEPTELP